RKLGVSPSAATRTRAVFDDVWKVTPELAARCLGSVATMPKLLFRQEVSALSEHNVTRRLAAKRGLYRRKGSRWTWHAGQRNYLFVDGREYPAATGAQTKALLEHLCSQRHLTANAISAVRDADRPLLRQLVSDGH